MPTSARKQHRIGTGGPWGTGLLVLGVGYIAQGIGYLTSPASSLPDALGAFGDTVPIRFWAVLWVAAGVWGVVKALNPPQKHSDVWPLVAITVLWSATYLIHWLVLGIFDGDWTRTWSTAVAWACLATVIVSLGRCVNPPRGHA